MQSENYIKEKELPNIPKSISFEVLGILASKAKKNI